jgi:parallel beta-helix repeat protein
MEMSWYKGRIGLTLGLTAAVLVWSTPNARADEIAVDCSNGESLQAAVAQAAPGDQLMVSGTCSETVVVRAEAARLTLDGQRSATIEAPPTAPNTVLILGRDITLRGFTIAGGRTGIGVFRGAVAVIENNTINGGARAGVGGQGISVGQHSYAQITDNVIEANSAAGVEVIEGSYARIGLGFNPSDPALHGNQIRNNGVQGGVFVSLASGARIDGNMISGNAGFGVVIAANSQAVLSANHIDGNAAGGVRVTQDSTVQLGGEAGGVLDAPNETTKPNSGYGLSCTLNSSVVGSQGALSGMQGGREVDESCAHRLTP